MSLNIQNKSEIYNKVEISKFLSNVNRYKNCGQQISNFPEVMKVMPFRGL